MKKQLFALFAVLTLATSLTALADENDGPADEVAATVRVFQQPNYQGSSMTITRVGCSTLYGIPERPILSANAAGVATLFEAADCRGRSVRLSNNGVPDVRRLGWQSIGSVDIP